MKALIYSFKATLLFALVTLMLTSCKEDDPQLTLKLQHSTLYINSFDTTAEVGYSAPGATKVTLAGVPEGWTAEVNTSKQKIVITSPAADAEEYVTWGSLTVTASTEEAISVSRKLFLSMNTPIDLSDRQSNCYIITEADQAYFIPITRRGEGSESLATSSVKVVWQSPGSLIDALELYDDKLHFQITADGDGELIPGNALLAAYNASGEVIWTWHIWVTPTEPQAVGRYMDRNLGAAYADPESDKERILQSYGTYYQWGRMTPFVGPYAYNCAASMDGNLYNEGSKRLLYLTYAPATASTGTPEYAMSHPLTFLLGSEESGYDWCYAHDNTLWQSSGAKSLYDPCPKGWRVADSFEGLAIADSLEGDLAALEAQFGWHMQVGEAESFFLGGGRRSWLEGLITNVNTLETPKPWIGYYWTSNSTSAGEAEAMYFSLDTEDASRSELQTALSSPRANGMQVRCIRE